MAITKIPPAGLEDTGVGAGTVGSASQIPIITVNAAKDQNKLTFDGSSETMEVQNQSFGPEEQRPYILRAKGRATTSAKGWKEYSFKFTPEKSGYVWISLEGEYPPKEEPNLVFKVDYDDVVVEGPTIKNGDFEDMGDDGVANSWKWSGEVIPNDGASAQSGDHFVTATANNRIGQTVMVTGGQPVTITFNARADAR